MPYKNGRWVPPRSRSQTQPVYKPAPTSSPSPMASPASMGEMIRAGEQATMGSPNNAVGGRNTYNRGQGYAKPKSAFDMGKKFGERAALGRLLTGHVSTGPKMNGAIFGLIKSASRYANAAKSAWDMTNFVIGKNAKYNTKAVNPGGYTLVWQCQGAPHFWSSSAGPTEAACANGSLSVLGEGAIGHSNPRARNIYLWENTGARYGPNPDFFYAKASAWWTRPRDNPAPMPWSHTLEKSGTVIGPQPLAVNAPTRGPYSYVDTAPKPEIQTGYSQPLPTPGTNPGTQTWPYTFPLPSTQVVPVTGRPVVTPTKTQPIEPPGRGNKQNKWNTNTLIARLGRLALQVSEGIDAVEAITKALPKDALDECKRKAAARQRQAKKEGRQYHALSRKMTPQEMMGCLAANWEQIDVGDALMELIMNQIGDMWAGFQYGAFDKALKISGREVLRTPFEHVPMPDFREGKFWEEVLSYLDNKESEK